MDAIKINTSRAELDIKTTPAKLNIEHPKPKMKVTHKRASFRTKRTLPTFKLNWDKAREGVGLPVGFLHAMQKHAAESGNKTLEAIAAIAQRGDQKANFYTRQSAAAEISRADMRKKIPEVNVRSNQPGLPEVEWENGSLVVEWQNYQLHIEWEIEKPVVQVEPYSVEIKVRNRPKVTITVDPDHVPKQPSGRRVDKKV